MATTIQILKNARNIANFATSEGVLSKKLVRRPSYGHIGAVLADSILQAGLNYSSVVRPRIDNILRTFPEMDRVSHLVKLVNSKQTGSFLSWKHPEKIARFEDLVVFLYNNKVESATELHSHLLCDAFCCDLLQLNGIGPKTIDYMSCLVGIDSIAVDRHIRSFATRVGVEKGNYQFLKKVFCCAADLLSLARRDFDAWVWHRESSRASAQYSLPFEAV